MKNILSFTFLVLLSFTSFAQGEFTFTPSKPKPGDAITISYKPAAVVPVKISGTELKGAATTDLDFEAKRTAGKYVATFKTDTASTFVFFTVIAGGAPDNNQGNGYTIELYENDKPRKGANLSRSYFYQYYGEEAGITSDKERALSALEREVQLHPDNRPAKLSVLRMKLAADAAKGNVLIQEEIDAFKPEGLKTEDDYNYLSQLYSIAKQSDNLKALTAEKKEKFPQGNWVATEMISKFYAEKDIVKKKELYTEMLSNIETKENWKKSQVAIPSFQNDILRAYIKDKNWSGLKAGIEEYGLYPEKLERENDKNLIINTYNSAAWTMYQDSADLAFAQELAQKAVNYWDAKNKEAVAQKKSEKIIKNGKSTYAMYADTYAAVLFKAGKYKQGYPLAKEVALEIGEGKNATYNSIYAQLAEKVLPAAEYKPQLEKFVVDGKSSSEIKDILKRAYVKEKKSEEGFGGYIAGLEEHAKLKMREDLAKKIENKPAPVFSLVNLDGSQVKLEDLKGKTVIVDFWATWCGPCIASFPGMKKAQEKYKDDPGVKFVFINAWENVKDIKKEVTDFIAKGAYPFDVLFDLDNKVIGSYGVSGIPTKFIVDKKGNIRFTSIGFSGSADKLVDELSAMIELAETE